MGWMLLNKEERKLAEMIEIARANTDTNRFAEGSKLAREKGFHEITADSSASKDMLLAEPLKNAPKRRRSTLGQFEIVRLFPVELTPGVAEDKRRLVSAGGIDAAVYGDSASRIRRKLVEVGFAEGHPMLAVVKGSAEKSNNKLIGKICGVYYQLGVPTADQYNGKPIYQKVEES